MVVLPVSVRDCTLLCIVPVTDCLDDWAFLEQAWHFQAPRPPHLPMGHCQSRYPDGSFEERNIASLWELSPVEDFLLSILHRRICNVLLPEQGKHVLVSSQASAWISATKFGCKINASFDNVCMLWILKYFRVCASWVGSLLRQMFHARGSVYFVENRL